MSSGTDTDTTPTHLFVAIPNNSGSTLAARLISQSPDFLTLGSEGQHVDGFDGPIPRDLGSALVFTETPVLADAESYDWRAIEEAWERRWAAAAEMNPRGKVRLEKSPPNVMRVPLLAHRFPRSRFVIGCRDPYAMVEGIMRRRPEVAVERAARHALSCLRWTQSNASWMMGRALITSYETMCAEPGKFVDGVARLCGTTPVPLAADVTLTIKGRTSRGVVDYNAEQIDRLTAGQIEAITAVLMADECTVRQMGYTLR